MKNHFLRVCLLAFLLGAFVALGPRPAHAQRPLGIDVSSYQGSADSPPTNINWTGVKNAGIAFSWTKATEGTGYFDADFVYNMTQAKAAGVLIGAYHFARPDLHTGTNGADLEAAYFWNHVKTYITNGGFYLMPMLDYEQTVTGTSPAYTKATLSAWANRWCQDLVNYGTSNGVTVLPVIYTYTSYSSGSSGNAPGLDTTVTNWPLWMASYPGSPNPQTGAPSSTAPWTTWSFWQYSSTTPLGGIEGVVDKDVINGTATTLGNFVIGGGLPVITNQPTNLTVLQSGTANFTVSTTVTNNINFQWQLGGTNLAGATNSTLTITNAQSTDAGIYDVLVSNVVGSVTSSNALLTVIPLISNVVIMPRSTSVIFTWDTATNLAGVATVSATTNFGAYAVPAIFTLHHSAYLPGLLPNSAYYFQIYAGDNVQYFAISNGTFSTDVSLIVPASQASYSGVWTVASAAPDKFSPNYEFASTTTGSATATAVFRPTIASAGLYDVYVWYSQGTNRSVNAPVLVSYPGGSITTNFDETTNGGSWRLVTTRLNLAVGTNAFVRISNDSGETGKVVIADAVKFVYSAGQDIPVNNTPPAWWTSYYFGTNSVDPSLDADGDGYSTSAEYVLGTDPTQYSALYVNAQATDTGGVQINFAPYLPGGRQYQLQGRTSVSSGVWTNLPLMPVTTNSFGDGVMTVTNPVAPLDLFRLSVSVTQ